MSGYIIRRVAYTVTVLIAVSIFGFIIIELPPGTSCPPRWRSSRRPASASTRRWWMRCACSTGSDKPVYLRYLTWMRRLVSGSPGMSLDWNRPVMELILERLPLTILLTGATLIFTYLVAIPIGIYSATHQYSLGDYTFTALGFIGLATPNFPARPDPHVPAVQAVRDLHRRTVLTGIRARRVEPGQGARHARPTWWRRSSSSAPPAPPG